MVISRTPLRVSFAGGGSDLAWYARRHGGMVVSATISQSVHVVVNARFEGGVRASYSRTENVETPDLLEHDLLREAFRTVGWLPGGVEIATIADVPGRGSGLGASSAVTVGALNALCAYRGRHVSSRELAEAACEIELGTLGKPIGRQDQYASAFGGLQAIRFGRDEGVECERLILSKENLDRLEGSLLAFWTGRHRSADAVLGALGRGDEGLLHELRDLAEVLYEDMRRGDADTLGPHLLEGWRLKRRLGGVTDPQIDAWVDAGIDAGATGGKLLGAGGGGFLLFYVPERYRPDVRAVLSDLRELPISLDAAGSRVTYVG